VRKPRWDLSVSPRPVACFDVARTSCRLREAGMLGSLEPKTDQVASRGVETDSPTQPKTDRDGLHASQRDPEAFVEVFEDHFDAVYGYLARRAGRDLAEELAAETFMIAFDRRADYDVRRGEVRSWLLGIATNLMRRHRRRERIELRAYRRVGVDPAPEPHVGVPAQLDAAAARATLARALGSLPLRYRDVLLLWTYGELGYEEIAHALAIPVGTVRSRLHRARSEMRAALQHNGEGSPHGRS
jgi:RNA polymerase sigma factor (sigma-70 family)